MLTRQINDDGDNDDDGDDDDDDDESMLLGRNDDLSGIYGGKATLRGEGKVLQQFCPSLPLLLPFFCYKKRKSLQFTVSYLSVCRFDVKDLGDNIIYPEFSHGRILIHTSNLMEKKNQKISFKRD